MYKSEGYCGKSMCLLKVLIGLTILLASLLYIVDITAIELPDHLMSFRLTSGGPVYNWAELRAQQEHEWDKAFFVDTDGCKMPSFPVLNDQIKKFVTEEKPIVCRPAMTKSSNTSIWISLNRTELKQIYKVDDVDRLHCVLVPFYRESDFDNRFDHTGAMRFGYGDVVEVGAFEFVRVNCDYSGAGQIYLDYHYFVPVKKPSSDSPETDASAKMSVLVVGIDSVSRLNFHRQMNRTASIILNDLNGVEMFGYNKVEDNTYPNLVPALTGLDESELASTCLPFKNSSYDRCHFIWDHFRRKGFKTVLSEDMASLGLFNYLRRGFEKQATDFNIRPVLLEMEAHISATKSTNTHLCLGSRRPVDIILDYANRFINSIGTAFPYFAFFWSASYTHDYLNYPQLIDEDFANFLTNLKDTGALNNTFLVLMSDHGIRWGSYRSTYQGMMEERQPFIYLMPPKWFPDKYPIAMKTLLTNRRHLTTHFDLYETLHDLIDPDTSLAPAVIKERASELIENEPLPRGISLFLPVPPSRTCYLAGISPHWCTCHEKNPIATSDARALPVARMIVQSINAMVKSYPQCQPLSLNSIAGANVGISNLGMVGTKNSTAHKFADVTVRLQTKPGYAEFEATVRMHSDGELELTGTISRTNLYGKQSQCVDDYKVKLYCFCDSYL